MKTISLGIGSVIALDKILHTVKSRPFFSFFFYFLISCFQAKRYKVLPNILACTFVKKKEKSLIWGFGLASLFCWLIGWFVVFFLNVGILQHFRWHLSSLNPISLGFLSSALKI